MEIGQKKYERWKVERIWGWEPEFGKSSRQKKRVYAKTEKVGLWSTLEDK